MLQLVGAITLVVAIAAGSSALAAQSTNHNPLMPNAAKPLSRAEASTVIGRNEMQPMFFAPKMQSPPGAVPFSGPAPATAPLRTDSR